MFTKAARCILRRPQSQAYCEQSGMLAYVRSCSESAACQLPIFLMQISYISHNLCMMFRLSVMAVPTDEGEELLCRMAMSGKKKKGREGGSTIQHAVEGRVKYRI